MKRITALLLAAVMLFAFAACKPEIDTSPDQPIETVIPEVPKEPESITVPLPERR